MGIINELYESDVFRTERLSKSSKKYRKTFERLCELEEQLLEKCPECEEVFRAYQSAELDLAELNYRYEFARGLRTGARLIMEVNKA